MSCEGQERGHYMKATHLDDGIVWMCVSCGLTRRMGR